MFDAHETRSNNFLLLLIFFQSFVLVFAFYFYDILVFTRISLSSRTIWFLNQKVFAIKLLHVHIYFNKIGQTLVFQIKK
jgi:hypothetical protein